MLITGRLAMITAVFAYKLKKTRDSRKAKIRHVVLLQFTEKATPEAISALYAALKKMQSQVPEIISYTFGSDLNEVEDQADFAIVADFKTEEDYKKYADSKPHEDLVNNLLKPMLKSRTAIKFSIN